MRGVLFLKICPAVLKILENTFIIQKYSTFAVVVIAKKKTILEIAEKKINEILTVH